MSNSNGRSTSKQKIKAGISIRSLEKADPTDHRPIINILCRLSVAEKHRSLEVISVSVCSYIEVTMADGKANIGEIIADLLFSQDLFMILKAVFIMECLFIKEHIFSLQWQTKSTPNVVVQFKIR